MKNAVCLHTALAALLFTSGCNSADKPAAVAATSQPAPATTTPKGDELPALNDSLLDLKPGIALQLPKSRHGETYLQVVSAKMLKAVPMQVKLPVLWATQPSSPKVLPGYRLSYKATLIWKPISRGPDQQSELLLPFWAPTGADSLASFYAGSLPTGAGASSYKAAQLAPNQPFTVQGTLYTYQGRTAQQQPALIVYPYERPGGASSDAFRQLALPLRLAQ